MVFFSNCKINLGLNVVEKRPDGFHNLESVFYPINWCDCIEFVESTSSNKKIKMSFSGLTIEGNPKDNILYKAYNLLILNGYKMPALKVHLHKVLPTGAGLGGGSANAAFFIKELNNYFQLKISDVKTLAFASELGADCAFFIKNKPVYAYNKGTDFIPVNINLANYYIALVYPGIGSNTKLAYQGLTPQFPKYNLKESILTLPLKKWKGTITNDFEDTIFEKIPETKQLKEYLYKKGAIYASLSGSGSSVFGIFLEKPNLSFSNNFLHFIQEPTL